jgi:ribosomal protein S18 acetylase RimI-like enzyme
MMKLQLENDPWLSSEMAKEVYALKGLEVPIATQDQSSVHQIVGWERAKKLNSPCFVYAKVNPLNINGMRFLAKQGFYLVDTNIVLCKSNHDCTCCKESPAYSVREAEPSDKKFVEKIAGTAFQYSRFHLDDMISQTLANQIKVKWAGNYFAGLRGDAMLVAQSEGKVIGFLLLKFQGEELIIDLIAVETQFQKIGIATGLIYVAQKKYNSFKYVAVGTQLANYSSMMFYQGQGFSFKEARNIFHFHPE